MGPELKGLLEEINLKYNYDFRHYSTASMKRRVTQAIDSLGFHSILELQKKVIQDSACFHDLLQYLTVPVSEMFRDPSYFRSLREKVVPILKTYPSLKIWVAGCSTGEEVYSLAILLKEEGLLSRTILYATDINPRSLEKAEQGIFNLEDIQKYSENYQKSGGKRLFSDYFTESGKGRLSTVTFNKTLRKNVTFSDHSLVTDAVFSETHLISCRNVLIYFDHELKDKAIGLFQESLCRKGFLGLGAKETLQFSHHSNAFSSFVKEDRIYQKN